MNSTQLIISSAPQLLRGAATTFQVWLLSVSFSITIGTIWGIICSNRLWIPGLSQLVSSITFILRSIPFYVQLLIMYFVLPDLLGLNLSPMTSGVLSLGLCSSAYIAQITRAGINALPTIQWEASYVLGYSTLQTVKSIILPQMLRNVVPALAGELDQLLKSTSILSAIGFMELTRVGMNIIDR